MPWQRVEEQSADGDPATRRAEADDRGDEELVEGVELAKEKVETHQQYAICTVVGGLGGRTSMRARELSERGQAPSIPEGR